VSSCKLNLKVIPGSSKSEIVGWLGESLKVKVAAPPDKGKANKEVEAVICNALELAKGTAQIVSGNTSQQKVVQIKGLSLSEVRKLLSLK
jgi:uncharacterized protein (TIGR00251 family)